MKIKLIISRVGADFVQNAGDVIEVSVEEAQRIIDAGQAELVREKKPEKAVSVRKFEKAKK